MIAPFKPVPSPEGVRSYFFTRQPNQYSGLMGWAVEGDYSFQGEMIPQPGFGAVHDVLDHIELGFPFDVDGELRAFGALYYRRVLADPSPFSVATTLRGVIGSQSGLVSCLPYPPDSLSYVTDRFAQDAFASIGYRLAREFCVDSRGIVERLACGWVTAQMAWPDQDWVRARSADAIRAFDELTSEVARCVLRVPHQLNYGHLSVEPVSLHPASVSHAVGV